MTSTRQFIPRFSFFPLIIILLLGFFTPCQAQRYRVQTLTIEGNTEYQLFFNNFHFASIIEVHPRGGIAFRPHPDRLDPNAWGSTFYVNPFLSDAEPAFGHVTHAAPVGNDSGILLKAGGDVAHGTSRSFGTWFFNITIRYNEASQRVLSSGGGLHVELNNPLSTVGLDLNLYRLASNYLIDVPLQTGGFGDTGDMVRAGVFYVSGIPSLNWSPRDGTTFPFTFSSTLAVNAIGDTNIVDTLKQNEPFQIAIARKPTTRIRYTSFAPGVALIFGGAFDNGKSQDFAADNVSLGALVIKGTTDTTSLDFGVQISSELPPSSAIDTDVIVSRLNNHEWILSRSLGNSFVNEIWGRWSSRVHWYHPLVGDFNGDGSVDVAAHTQSGAWYVGASSNTKFSTFRFGNWPRSFYWDNVLVGDFNGDGRSDVAGKMPNGEWDVGISEGSGFTFSQWGAWSSQVTWRDVLPGDFNGDGLTDIAARTGTGRWWIAISDGGAFHNRYYGAWGNTLPWNDVKVGDFNGDGLSDIAGRRAGRWWVAQSNGSRFTNSYWGRWSNQASWEDVLVGDFNGDGRDDITGRAGSSVYVSISNGAGFSVAKWSTWSNPSQIEESLIGDFNRDGLADIASKSGSNWWVNRSQGDSFALSDWSRILPRGLEVVGSSHERG